MKAPDALGYHPPPSHLMRPVSPPGEANLSGESLNESICEVPKDVAGDPQSTDSGRQE